MSEEHYPARSVGNEDIIAFDLIKMIDSMQKEEFINSLKAKDERDRLDFSEVFFDTELSQPLFPKGRTARTLCKECNRFLGKYDEAYLRFFQADGQPELIKGFQQQTKLKIIKAIFAKFLSVPETEGEEFDFIDFIRAETKFEYDGDWKIYFFKRNPTADFWGLKDIRTGMLTFENGVVYELSDEKFIFDLMNFEKHSCLHMNNIFDILSKKYIIAEEAGANSEYHSQILMTSFLSQLR